jgi:hypothetical protein
MVGQVEEITLCHHLAPVGKITCRLVQDLSHQYSGQMVFRAGCGADTGCAVLETWSSEESGSSISSRRGEPARPGPGPPVAPRPKASGGVRQGPNPIVQRSGRRRSAVPPRGRGHNAGCRLREMGRAGHPERRNRYAAFQGVVQLLQKRVPRRQPDLAVRRRSPATRLSGVCPEAQRWW